MYAPPDPKHSRCGRRVPTPAGHLFEPTLNSEFSTLLAAAEEALASGRSVELKDLLARLQQLAGDSAVCWEGIGQLCRRAGDPDGGRQALGRAVSLDPRNPNLRLALAGLLRETGRPVEAVDQVEAACRLAPTAPAPAHLMGAMYLERGIIGGALDWLRRARAAGSDSAQLHADLGLALQTDGRLEEAEASYRRALEKAPAYEPALRGVARLARLRRRPEEGLAVLEPLAAQIHSGGLLAELAGLMATVGRAEEARAMLESRLEGLEDDEGRMEIHFRLGELYDAAGNPEAAMRHLRIANRMKRVAFDPAGYAALVDRLLAVFDRQSMRQLPKATHGDSRPVFIVGMPRSGTSLVEQILASHSQVYGAGELSDMGLLALSTAGSGAEYPESVRALGPDQVERLAGAYRQRLDSMAPKARRITDKMWQNFEFLGFIALLFPEARVIHCTRDPMDTALSCFFHHFYGDGMPFAYDLENLGAFYRQYCRMMNHWRSVLPLPIHEVNYERMVADPETHIRALVDFAGLDWAPDCLRFFETDRVVKTASLDQVRRPIYDTSVGRYRRYEQWLAPLTRALREEAP